MRLQGLVDGQAVENVPTGRVEVDLQRLALDLAELVDEILRGVAPVADLVVDVEGGRLAGLVLDPVPVGPPTLLARQGPPDPGQEVFPGHSFASLAGLGFFGGWFGSVPLSPTWDSRPIRADSRAAS